MTAETAADWVRVPFPPTRPLVSESPWNFDAETGILTCQAKGIHEAYLHPVPKGDGVLHVEWRYPDAPEKTNSGIFIRTSSDGTVWHQAQLATASLGMFFGTTAAEKKFREGIRRPELERPAGEWNQMEVTCKGSLITITINGTEVIQWECPVTEGHIGLEAEFTPIEFRNIRFKPLP